MNVTEGSNFNMRLKLTAFEERYSLFVSPNWERVKMLLGPRVDLMTYNMHNNCASTAISSEIYDCYAVDVFAGNGRSTLGIEVASALSVMLPTFGLESIKIIIFDYQDLKSLPPYIFYSTTAQMYKITTDVTFVRCHAHNIRTTAAVFEDERYVVTLIGDDYEILISIFKK